MKPRVVSPKNYHNIINTAVILAKKLLATMHLCQNLLLLLFGLSPVTVNSKLKGQRSLPEEDDESLVLIETKPCISFGLTFVETAIEEGPRNPSGMYSPECDKNECPDGCCRAYTYVLHCDKTNQLPQLPVRTKI
jgi:hypothetical protein